MKHTKRVVAVAVLLLAVAGESEGQSAYEHASLEAHRWEVYAAGDAAKQARVMLNRAREHRTFREPDVKKARNKVAQEKDKAARGNRDPDDLAEAEAKLFDVEKHVSVTEARIVAAQSYLAVSEARVVSAEAVVVAAEAASEEALSTALIAFRGLLDIITIDEGKLPQEVSFAPHNDNPSADQVATVWGRAALAAGASERAEAIVKALNDGGEVPQELLEPLPTEFRELAQVVAQEPEKEDGEDYLEKCDTTKNGKITCAEARACGLKTPITKDHPAYQYMDDRDGDGQVCE